MADSKPNAFNQLGIFILTAIVIVLLVLILFMLRICVRASPKVNKLYQGLKKKLFFKVFINYVLLGTLKI